MFLLKSNLECLKQPDLLLPSRLTYLLDLFHLLNLFHLLRFLRSRFQVYLDLLSSIIQVFERNLNLVSAILSNNNLDLFVLMKYLLLWRVPCLLPEIRDVAFHTVKLELRSLRLERLFVNRLPSRSTTLPRTLSALISQTHRYHIELIVILNLSLITFYLRLHLQLELLIFYLNALFQARLLVVQVFQY
jgi:hypothetical protein